MFVNERVTSHLSQHRLWFLTTRYTRVRNETQHHDILISNHAPCLHCLILFLFKCFFFWVEITSCQLATLATSFRASQSVSTFPGSYLEPFRPRCSHGELLPHLREARLLRWVRLASSCFFDHFVSFLFFLKLVFPFPLFFWGGCLFDCLVIISAL